VEIRARSKVIFNLLSYPKVRVFCRADAEGKAIQFSLLQLKKDTASVGDREIEARAAAVAELKITCTVLATKFEQNVYMIDLRKPFC
jgi:hypothetical protein